MSQVNITQAAQLAGISRSHFHRHYVKTGKVTATKDSKGKPQIDIAELLRVFGVLNDPGSESSTVDSTAHDSTPHHIQQHTFEEAKILRQQLQEAKEREQEYRDRETFYQKQIQGLTDTMKLLEAPKQPQHPRLWYQFWK